MKACKVSCFFSRKGSLCPPGGWGFLGFFADAAEAAPVAQDSAAVDLSSAGSLRTDCARYVKAVLQDDHQQMVAYMPEQVIALAGGREPVMRSLKQAGDQMRAAGYSLVEAKIESLFPVQKVGAQSIAFARQMNSGSSSGRRAHDLPLSAPCSF